MPEEESSTQPTIDSQEAAAADVKFYRSEDFFSTYANNVQFEPSVWDLKMIFGMLDQREAPKVAQHISISIPWLQVKLLILFLQLVLAHQESQNGRIRIPDKMPVKNTPLPDFANSPPELKPLIEAIHKTFEAFTAD